MQINADIVHPRAYIQCLQPLLQAPSRYRDDVPPRFVRHPRQFPQRGYRLRQMLNPHQTGKHIKRAIGKRQITYRSAK